MWAYVIRRILLAVPTILGVTIVVFLIMRIAPGDVAIMMLGGGEGGGGIDPEALERIRTELGLNKPLYEQYLGWIYGLFTLDFGKSFFYNADMDRLIARKAPLSLQVGLMGLIIGSILGIAGGVIAALKQDTFFDYLIRGIAILGISVPTFWSGMMLILIFVRLFDWIPRQGYIPIWEDPVANLAQLIWPALIIGLGFLMGVPLRMMRATMLEVMREDYISHRASEGSQGARDYRAPRHAERPDSGAYPDWHLPADYRDRPRRHGTGLRSSGHWPHDGGFHQPTRFPSRSARCDAYRLCRCRCESGRGTCYTVGLTQGFGTKPSGRCVRREPATFRLKIG